MWRLPSSQVGANHCAQELCYLSSPEGSSTASKGHRCLRRHVRCTNEGTVCQAGQGGGGTGLNEGGGPRQGSRRREPTGSGTGAVEHCRRGSHFESVRTAAHRAGVEAPGTGTVAVALHILGTVRDTVDEEVEVHAVGGVGHCPASGTGHHATPGADASNVEGRDARSSTIQCYLVGADRLGGWLQGSWTRNYSCPAEPYQKPAQVEIQFKVRDSSGMDSPVQTSRFYCR